MAKQKNRPGRNLLALTLAAAVAIAALIIGHFTDEAPLTPKLALDLEGGTQLILTPKLVEGTEDKAVTSEDMDEAISIIRQRVDASGVAEAEISTLGSNNIVVALPGETDEDILNLVRSSATMRFRPVIEISMPGVADSAELGAPETLEGAELDEFIHALADTDGDGVLSDQPTGTPADNSDFAWASEQLIYEFLTLDCTDPANLTGDRIDNPEEPLVACNVDGAEKYLLGPVDVEGTHLKRASAAMGQSPTGQPTGQYVVALELDAEGASQFAEASQRLYDLADTDVMRNRFAVVLDGNVIVAPSMNVPIADGRAEISGSFTATEAQTLANQLQFGSLPLNFEVQSEQQISATLGSNHLEKGLWAGLVGLLLVVLYMAWQYRGLALLSAGSLIVAGILTYLTITLLSWTMGYRLSLPGVAGLIVAVGFTADSFIVYFERIRDVVRDGRPLGVAVEEGWVRARRTILISDAVNLVAATVLYVLAVGGVQGFAFTLGVTTVMDLIVVFFFTHPMMSLLVRTKFFGDGHKLSGLDRKHLGAKSGVRYEGRGRVSAPSKAKDEKSLFDPQPTASKKEPVAVGGGKKLSLAERRRLEAQKEATAGSDVKEPQDG